MTESPTKGSLKAKFEFAANLATILIAVLVLGFIGRSYFSSTRHAGSQISVGAKLNLNSENWGQNGRTIVLAMSTSCHFCTESADFYRRLVQACEARHVRMVAILPQSVSEGNDYLQKLNIRVDEVRQAALREFQIQGTPTVLLVDSRGAVQDVWVGKLPPEKEVEVLKKMQS